MKHSIATIGPGKHVVRRGPDEIGMVSFDRPVEHEATALRALCEALDVHVHRWVYSDERDVFVCTGCGAVEEAQ